MAGAEGLEPSARGFGDCGNNLQNRYLIRFSAPAFKFDTNSDTIVVSGCMRFIN